MHLVEYYVLYLALNDMCCVNKMQFVGVGILLEKNAKLSFNVFQT